MGQRLFILIFSSKFKAFFFLKQLKNFKTKKILLQFFLNDKILRLKTLQQIRTLGKILLKNRILKKERKIDFIENFYKFKHLELEQILEFFFVFDIIELEREYFDIFEAIEEELLKKFRLYEEKFSFLDKKEKILLHKFSKSNRKFYSKDKESVDNLLALGILALEKSLEEKPEKNKHQKLKKNLRKYQIRDKIHFKASFVRFYFRFIWPNLSELEQGNFSQVLEKIRSDFENFSSLPFELLAQQLIAKKFALKELSSLWIKEIEIDIFSQEEKILVGEVKYKERKVNKNLYNSLLAKCEKLKIQADFLVLVAKNGFSKEVEKIKDERLFTFTLKDFYELLPQHFLKESGKKIRKKF